MKMCIFDSEASCPGDTAVLVLKQEREDDFLNRRARSGGRDKAFVLIARTSAVTVIEARHCNTCVLFWIRASGLRRERVCAWGWDPTRF